MSPDGPNLLNYILCRLLFGTQFYAIVIVDSS